MIVEQHYLSCLSQASYLLVDETSKVAAVVDPRRDVELYLERAEALGVEIRHVLLTHFHADFLAGHLELQKRTGATIHLGARARADYGFSSLGEGDGLELGPELRLAILETPGHTPEGISILVFDRARSEEEPHAVLTGDTLFIGDVGRPDLMASIGITAEELAGMLYDSTREKLLTLPDDTILYPGHGAGSACGKSLSSETSCTIGRQRENNYALQPMERETFIGMVTAGQPTAPAYFARAAGLNRSEHGLLEEALASSLRPLSLEELRARQQEGAQVLDTRHKDAFAAGHLAGSINIGLDGRFASWAGSVLELETPIVLVADPGTEREAALRLGRIGLDRVAGYLEGPLPAEAATATVPRTSVGELAAALDGGAFVLDVRGPGEFEGGHLEGAKSIPLPQLTSRLAELPGDCPIHVHCQSGYRSMTALSLLQRAGLTSAIDVDGGFEAWTAAALSVVHPEPSARRRRATRPLPSWPRWCWASSTASTRASTSTTSPRAAPPP